MIQQHQRDDLIGKVSHAATTLPEPEFRLLEASFRKFLSETSLQKFLSAVDETEFQGGKERTRPSSLGTAIGDSGYEIDKRASTAEDESRLKPQELHDRPGQVPEADESTPPLDEVESLRALSFELLQGVQELGPQAVLVVIETVRELFGHALHLYDAQIILQELKDLAIPMWRDRHQLPPEEQVENAEAWLRKHYGRYLSYYGAPVDRLFQFILEKYDGDLVVQLRSDAKREKLTARMLQDIIGSKSEYLEALRRLLPPPAEELFARLYAARQRKAARQATSSP